jgi:hypothetical protein
MFNITASFLVMDHVAHTYIAAGFNFVLIQILTRVNLLDVNLKFYTVTKFAILVIRASHDLIQNLQILL